MTRTSGRRWEEDDAGQVCTWGWVLTRDPSKFTFSWLIAPNWGVPTRRRRQLRDSHLYPVQIRHVRHNRARCEARYDYETELEYGLDVILDGLEKDW